MRPPNESHRRFFALKTANTSAAVGYRRDDGVVGRYNRPLYLLVVHARAEAPITIAIGPVMIITTYGHLSRKVEITVIE